MGYEVPRHYRNRVRIMLKPLEERVAANLIKNLTEKDLGQIRANANKEKSK